MLRKMPIIAIFGQGSPIGAERVAREGRSGFSIGVVPCDPKGPFDRPNRREDDRPYPNPFVEIAIMTPLTPRVPDWRTMPGRNHVNVLTADAVLSLPGETGTRNELDMAAEYRGERERPAQQRHTVLLGPADEFTPEHRGMFVHAGTLAEAERHLLGVLAAHGL